MVMASSAFLYEKQACLLGCRAASEGFYRKVLEDSLEWDFSKLFVQTFVVFTQILAAAEVLTDRVLTVRAALVSYAPLLFSLASTKQNLKI